MASRQRRGPDRPPQPTLTGAATRVASWPITWSMFTSWPVPIRRGATSRPASWTSGPASLAQESVTVHGAYPRSKASAADFTTRLPVAIPQKARYVQPVRRISSADSGVKSVYPVLSTTARVTRRLGELGNDVALGCFLEPAPWEEALGRAVRIVEVPGEVHRAPGGGPSGDEVGDWGHDVAAVVVHEAVPHVDSRPVRHCRCRSARTPARRSRAERPARAQSFGQSAGLHDGLPHQDVLRLLGNGLW